MNTNISRSTPTPHEPEPGYERVFLLTPGEVIELLRLLDQPSRTDVGFRIDREEYVRRRVQGGRTIGKRQVVEAAIHLILRIGLAVVVQQDVPFEWSEAAPNAKPDLKSRSEAAPINIGSKVSEASTNGPQSSVPVYETSAPMIPSLGLDASDSAPKLSHHQTGSSPCPVDVEKVVQGTETPAATALPPEPTGSGPAPSDTETPTGPSGSYSVRPTHPMNKERSRSRLVGALCLLFAIVFMLVAGYYGYFRF